MAHVARESGLVHDVGVLAALHDGVNAALVVGGAADVVAAHLVTLQVEDAHEDALGGQVLDHRRHQRVGGQALHLQLGDGAQNIGHHGRVGGLAVGQPFGGAAAGEHHFVPFAVGHEDLADVVQVRVGELALGVVGQGARRPFFAQGEEGEDAEEDNGQEEEGRAVHKAGLAGVAPAAEEVEKDAEEGQQQEGQTDVQQPVGSSAGQGGLAVGQA